MWHSIARFVRGTHRGNISFWLTCALLAVLMQSVGLVHRIQHGEPLYAVLLAPAGESADAATDTRTQFHHTHSCVLFDGDTVFTGGPSMPPALHLSQNHPEASVQTARVPVDLPLVRGFRSRAPPAGSLPA